MKYDKNNVITRERERERERGREGGREGGRDGGIHKTLRSQSDHWGNTVSPHIGDRNNERQFYYSATIASMLASSVRRVVYIGLGIFALYSRTRLNGTRIIGIPG